MTLSIKEKENQRIDFIKSDKFGMDTFQTLFMFKINSLGMLTNIQLIGTLIEKIDDSDLFGHKLTAEQLIQSKQFLSLDVISKIIYIIESLFVVINSLESGYDGISRNMIEYRSVWKIIKKIKLRSYNMPKILAYPSIDTLDIPENQKEEMTQIYSQISDITYEALDNLVEFQNKFNIVHNKNKHGFSLRPNGVIAGPVNPDFFETSLTALDHKNSVDEMPAESFTSEVKEVNELWFNVESHINFNKKLFSEMNVAMKNLEIFCKDIVENNLEFANNCGQNYFPITRISNTKVIPRILGRNSTSSVSLEYLQEIISTMTNNAMELITIRKYEGTLGNTVKQNTITNIFIKPNMDENDDVLET